MRLWWLSSERMTVVVDTVNDIIVDGAPVVRKFRCQPLNNLIGWMKKQGGFRMEELHPIGAAPEKKED